MANNFGGIPILSWPVDEREQFYAFLSQQNPNLNLNQVIEDYRSNSFQNGIQPLFDSAPIKLNLGGESEKTKIKTTERPMGIFDFSLAARGLYRVQEYYSQKLAEDFPNKFDSYNLPKGIIPPNLVKETIIAGEKSFYYEDSDGFFPCVKQQKGTAGIDQNVKGEKLKFATKTKKVYLTYEKKKGKVKYVEIYSLFYFSRFNNDDIPYAIRHIPAIMVAEYLEKMGVQTRFYMTRFVELRGNQTTRLNYRLKEFNNGLRLPMYDEMRATPNTSYDRVLVFQPLIAKDFGEDFDKSFAFCISSNSTQSDIYQNILRYAQSQEVISSNIKNYGYPDWEQSEYWVGMERYRNKYVEYVKKGVFKSKEIQPESMLFYHDKNINIYLQDYLNIVRQAYRDVENNQNATFTDALTSPYINPFFNWWMKLSAYQLKFKIDIINSVELEKDIRLMRNEFDKLIDDLDLIIKNVPQNYENQGYKAYLERFSNNLLIQYRIKDRRGKRTFRLYIETITLEITTYAEGDIFATPQEDRDERDELVEKVMEIVSTYD